jgi:dihydroxyacetone kinase
MENGKAAPGDKTMVDAIVPFADALRGAADNGVGLAEAWSTAAGVARLAADATADLIPKLGRARTHGDRSLGTPDPGAVSFALIVDAIAGSMEHGTPDPAMPQRDEEETPA